MSYENALNQDDLPLELCHARDAKLEAMPITFDDNDKDIHHENSGNFSNY